MPTTPPPFADLPPTAAEHFKLYYFAAVLHVVEQIAQSFTSYEDVFTHYAFLVGYHEELAKRGLEGVEPDRRAAWWRDAVLAWEEGVAAHLPLRALRNSSGLGHEALTLLMSVGLTEEDARFGLLFESAQAAPGSTGRRSGCSTPGGASRSTAARSARACAGSRRSGSSPWSTPTPPGSSGRSRSPRRSGTRAGARPTRQSRPGPRIASRPRSPIRRA